MGSSLQTIPLINLTIMFIPVLATMALIYKWSTDYKSSLYAISRMLLQLLIVGYFLDYIFKVESAWIMLLILAVMSFSAAWIALRTVQSHRKALYAQALCSILMGGGFVLILVIWGVIELQPWNQPRYLIPLAGMIFSASLNSVSLAAERFQAEINRGEAYEQARSVAFRSSLIPVVNSLFAVGLVSVPGLMTGQILSGISPLIASRYQIMVMCMVFGASGISSACFLVLIKSRAAKFIAKK